jgi:hypothetical protein
MKISVSVAGNNIAPPPPCTARAAISSPGLFDSPATSEDSP